MKVIIYSIQDFEKAFLLKANQSNHELTLIEDMLTLQTAPLAKSHDAAVVFTGDDVSAEVIRKLNSIGVRYIVIRAAGYDNINIQTANELGMKCANVPDYSPYAIAEHAVALILCLNRKLILADSQVHRHNFTVGKLVGFDLHGKTAGIVGTGRIGSVVAKILNGFGCILLGYDIKRDASLTEQYDLRYVTLNELCASSDIITLNTPLNSTSKYLINKEKIDNMKPGVVLVNTGRGAVINTRDVIKALDAGKIGALGLDVYENEKGIFFSDFSKNKVNDEELNHLLRLPNVLITPHQAFATVEALTNIADTTFYSLDCWAQQKTPDNELPERGTDTGTYIPVSHIRLTTRRLRKKGKTLLS